MQVSKAEFAKIVGKSLTQVDNYVARGMPGYVKAVKRGAFATVHLEPAVQWVLAQTAGALNEAKTRESEERADKLNLEVRRLRGELLDRDLVARVWAKLASNFRSRILAIPTKLAGRLRGIDEPNVIREKIETELHLALAELSDEGAFNRRGGDPEDGAGLDEERPSPNAGDGGAAAAHEPEPVGRSEPTTQP